MKSFPLTPVNIGGGGVAGTIAYVQGKLSPDGTSATSSTISLALTAAVGSGNSICGEVTWDTSTATTITSIIDDKGNVYTLLDTIADNTNAQTSASFFGGPWTNSPQTITVTFSRPTGFRRMLLDEYSGATAVDAHHGQVANGTTAANNVSSGAATTTASGDRIWGAVCPDTGGGTITAGTGFTRRETGLAADNFNMTSEDMTQSAAGSIAATLTQTSSGRYVAFLIAMK